MNKADAKRVSNAYEYRIITYRKIQKSRKKINQKWPNNALIHEYKTLNNASNLFDTKIQKSIFL